VLAWPDAVLHGDRVTENNAIAMQPCSNVAMSDAHLGFVCHFSLANEVLHQLVLAPRRSVLWGPKSLLMTRVVGESLAHEPTTVSSLLMIEFANA
jgi:hypothetical protein